MHWTYRNVVMLLLLIGFTLAVATPSRADWLAYAINNYGAYGHGRGPTQRQAEDYALGYCGHRDCRIIMSTPRRCDAIAISHFHGLWYSTGVANSSRHASWHALRNCSRTLPQFSCRILMTYCQ